MADDLKKVGAAVEAFNAVLEQAKGATGVEFKEKFEVSKVLLTRKDEYPIHMKVSGDFMKGLKSSGPPPLTIQGLFGNEFRIANEQDMKTIGVGAAVGAAVGSVAARNGEGAAIGGAAGAAAAEALILKEGTQIVSVRVLTSADEADWNKRKLAVAKALSGDFEGARLELTKAYHPEQLKNQPAQAAAQAPAPVTGQNAVFQKNVDDLKASAPLFKDNVTPYPNGSVTISLTDDQYTHLQNNINSGKVKLQDVFGSNAFTFGVGLDNNSKHFLRVEPGKLTEDVVNNAKKYSLLIGIATQKDAPDQILDLKKTIDSLAGVDRGGPHGLGELGVQQAQNTRGRGGVSV